MLRNNKNNKKGVSIVGVPSIWMLPGYPITAHHVYTFLLYWLAVWRHNEPNLALKTKKCPRSIVGVPLRRDLYGKPYDRVPLVCILNFSGGFAVRQLELRTNKQTNRKQTNKGAPSQRRCTCKEGDVAGDQPRPERGLPVPQCLEQVCRPWFHRCHDGLPFQGRAS